MIAAIYARKSTQESGADADAKSVDRQIANARAFASARGWDIAEGHVYADDAVSGAETKKLVQRQRLLDVIASGRAPFNALIVRDQSRLSRRDGDEAFGELKAMAQSGVEVWFYLDGQQFEYGTFASNITGIVRAEMNAEFRRSIASWTREAMARKARAGHITGGRCFGYDNVRVNGHVERRINDGEAAVVRRIFEMAAGGAGFKRIAKTLNDEGSPCPRAQRSRPNGWTASSVRAILFRDVYRGVQVWGKTKKRDRSGSVNASKRPASEWMTVEVPEARLVSDELWASAQRRIKAAAAVYLRSTGGRLWGRPAVGLGSKYLLTGFAACGACPDPERRAGMMAHSFTTGHQRERYYVCCGYHNKGRSVCANGHRLPMKEADEAILTTLRDYVLHPEVVEGAIVDALEMLRPKVDSVDGRKRELSAQLHKVETETARLAEAVAQGGNLSSILAVLATRERERDGLLHQLAALDGVKDLSRADVRRIEQDLRGRVREWRGLLRRQPQVARQILSKLVGERRFVFTPETDGSWTFAGQATLGKLLEGSVLPLGWRPHRESTQTVTWPVLELRGIVRAA